MKKKKNTKDGIAARQIRTMKKKAVKKILVTVVLPGAATLLATATVKIFLRMQLRQIAQHTEPEGEEDGGDISAQTGDDVSAQAGGSASAKNDDGAAAQADSDVSAQTGGSSSAKNDGGAAQNTGAPAKAARVPVVLETSRPEFVTPEPVPTTTIRT